MIPRDFRDSLSPVNADVIALTACSAGMFFKEPMSPARTATVFDNSADSSAVAPIAFVTPPVNDKSCCSSEVVKPALLAKSSTNEPKDFSASLNVTEKAFALSSASEPNCRSLTPAAAAPAPRTKAPFEACLKDSGLNIGEVSNLVLVGGMTRSPKIVELAKELGGKDPHQGVNPDEVVAIGAAIQGAVLQGDVNDVLLLDVTPLTLGIETAGGVSTPMIERNTTIPTKKSQVFSTAADNQPAVDIVVLQGERSMSNDNKKLGDFKLDGIRPAPRGTPQIEVTFDIDANGILNVSAKDNDTGKDQKITISGSSSMDEDEVERLRKEAEKFADSDKEKKDQVQVRNELDSMVYQCEKQLSDLGEKAPRELKESIDGILAESKKVLDNQGSSLSELKEAKDSLQKTFEQLGQEAMKHSGAAGAGAETANESQSQESTDTKTAEKADKNDDIVDADFEVVDEADKKD